MGPPEEHRKVPTKAKHPNDLWRGRQYRAVDPLPMRNERAICARLTGDKPLKQGDSTYETPWKGRPPRQRHGWSPEWGGEVGIGGCQGLLWGDKRVLEPDGDGADGYTVLCALNGTQAHPAKWLILCFTKFTAAREKCVQWGKRVAERCEHNAKCAHYVKSVHGLAHAAPGKRRSGRGGRWW